MNQHRCLEQLVAITYLNSLNSGVLMKIRHLTTSLLFAVGCSLLTVGAASAQPKGPATMMAGKPVKYMVSWQERVAGSALE